VEDWIALVGDEEDFHVVSPTILAYMSGEGITLAGDAEDHMTSL
jgi:hypothetical protein